MAIVVVFFYSEIIFLSERILAIGQSQSFSQSSALRGLFLSVRLDSKERKKRGEISLNFSDLSEQYGVTNFPSNFFS